MSANPDSVAGQGEFRSRVPPSKPMTTKGHQPGQKVGNDAAPEFHAQTFPPGTAPKEHSFQPNPLSEIPGQAMNDNMIPEYRTGALDMPGATSKEIYNESAQSRPPQGQSARELRGAHAGKRKKERSGLEGVGASTSEGTVEGIAREKGADRPEGIEGGAKVGMGKSQGG